MRLPWGLASIAVAAIAAALIAGCAINTGDPYADLQPGATPSARPGAYVWVVGAPDLVLGSADGGATWKTCNRRKDGDIMTGDLWAVAFGDVDHGWAVRRGVASPTATVLATADAGKTWTWRYPGPKKGRLLAVAATDADHVWAVGYQFGKGPGLEGRSLVIASTDGGATWTRQRLPAAAGPFRVAFSDPRHGWILDGWRNLVYATSDGGAHWRITYRGANDGAVLRDVAAAGASRCWVVGYGAHETGFVARTSDGGRHWSTQAAVSPDKLEGVSFPDAGHGWAVGYGGTVIATTDGGASWKAQDAGADYGLVQVSFSDAQYGWARIGHLALLATEDGGQSWSVVRPTDTRDVLTGLATVDAPSVAGQ